MHKLANLYEKVDSKGRSYLIGDFLGITILIYANKNKGDKYQHDNELWLREKEEDQRPRISSGYQET